VADATDPVRLQIQPEGEARGMRIAGYPSDPMTGYTCTFGVRLVTAGACDKIAPCFACVPARRHGIEPAGRMRAKARHGDASPDPHGIVAPVAGFDRMAARTGSGCQAGFHPVPRREVPRMHEFATDEGRLGEVER
jgi:hypothetical protein